MSRSFKDYVTKITAIRKINPPGLENVAWLVNTMRFALPLATIYLYFRSLGFQKLGI